METPHIYFRMFRGIFFSSVDNCSSGDPYYQISSLSLFALLLWVATFNQSNDLIGMLVIISICWRMEKMQNWNIGNLHWLFFNFLWNCSLILILFVMLPVLSPMHFTRVQNLQILLWEKEESELDRLTSRLSQLYYENLLKVRFCHELLWVILCDSNAQN